LGSRDSVLDNSPLTALIDEYLNWQDLQRGTPLYVSVYKSNGGLIDLMGCIAAMLDMKDTAPSEFLLTTVFRARLEKCVNGFGCFTFAL
jgi:NTE family protein